MNKRLESALVTMGYDQDGKECGLKLASVLAPPFDIPSAIKRVCR